MIVRLPKQAVVLCGGLGIRLRPYTDKTPKPMVLCNGKPFLWHLLQQLHEQGINKFILLTGYLGEKIEDYFGNGGRFGWEIQYSLGLVEWDTGKRLWEAKKLLEESFILLYSDNFAPFPLGQVLQTHYKNSLPLTFMVTEKKPGNLILSDHGIVQKYNNNRLDADAKYVEIGYMVVEKKIVFDYFDNPECSFSSVISSMARNKKIGAWIQNDPYHSISDLIRWKKTEKYLQSKKIIFIDRDGVINKRAPKGKYITSWKDFEFIPDTFEVMKTLSKKGFKFIVITNQAGIARKKMGYNDLDDIHANLIAECRKNGIEILKIYVCPHHWDYDCDCRKPKPGMFYSASKDFEIRLDKTLFIGDDIRDCKAAYNAGLESIFLGVDSALKDLSDKQQPLYYSNKLSNILPNILNYFN
jgi:histidinol-phosphate phosphatase family protein